MWSLLKWCNNPIYRAEPRWKFPVLLNRYRSQIHQHILDRLRIWKQSLVNNVIFQILLFVISCFVLGLAIEAVMFRLIDLDNIKQSHPKHSVNKCPPSTRSSRSPQPRTPWPQRTPRPLAVPPPHRRHPRHTSSARTSSQYASSPPHHTPAVPH